MLNSWQSQQLVNNPGHLSTGESVFVGKKRLNTMCALENNSKVKAAVDFIGGTKRHWLCTHCMPMFEPWFGVFEQILGTLRYGDYGLRLDAPFLWLKHWADYATSGAKMRS